MKHIQIICMLLVLLLLLPASALASFDAVVTSSSMTVYASKSMTGTSASVPKGTKVTVVSYADGIAKITYKGYTGYARTSDMKAEDNVLTTTTVKTAARVYKSKSTSAASVKVSAGTKVNVLSLSGDWAYVEKNGYTGYIKKTDLTAYSSTSDPDSSAATKVLNAAKSKLGCKYVYGTTGPSTFDCAGFLKYCYKQAGVSVGGSAQTIGYNRGTKISYSELRVGDIVCFDTVSDKDLSDHVGIYIGSGKFVHCSSGAGKVIVSSLSSGYYKRVFSWGRRVL